MLRLPFLLAVLAATAAHAQPAPAVDYARLLDNRFLPQQGQFLFGQPRPDYLLFPPAGLDPYDVDAAYLVRDAEGAIVGGQRIGVLEPTGSAAFMLIRPRSGPEWNAALQDGGRYTLDVVFNQTTIGAVPFTVALTQSDDPFDPRTTFVLDGPWRTHAYFEHEADRPDYILHFNAWIAPDDMVSNTTTEVSMQRDGREVAWGSTVVDLSHGWGRAEYRLLTPASRPDDRGRHPSPQNFTVQDVTPGTYELVLSDAEGRVFRRMRAEAGTGTFVAHARSDVNYTPRPAFLTPRRMGGSALATAYNLYWVVNE
jgi:hypothetical protein